MDSPWTYFIIISIIIIALLFRIIKKYHYSYWKRRGVPYVEPTFPFGNFADPTTNKKPDFFYFQQCYEQLKRVGAKFGGFYANAVPIFVPIDPEYVKYILVKDSSAFQAIDLNLSKDRLSSENLFTLNNEKLSILRNKFMLTFTKTKFKDTFNMMAVTTENMNKYVEEDVIKSYPLNAKDYASRLTATLAGSFVLGRNYNNFQNDTTVSSLREIVVARDNLIKTSIRIGLTQLRAAVIAFKENNAVFDNLIYGGDSIDEIMKRRMEEDTSRDDFLQLLIEMKNEGIISMNELQTQCSNFFLNSFEIPSTIMSFLLYELAKNQDVQEKLRNEIFEILSKCNERRITYEAIMDMKYLDMVLCAKKIKSDDFTSY